MLSVGLLKPQIKLTGPATSNHFTLQSGHRMIVSTFFNGNIEYAFCSPAAVIYLFIFFFMKEPDDVLSVTLLLLVAAANQLCRVALNLVLLGKLLKFML